MIAEEFAKTYGQAKVKFVGRVLQIGEVRTSCVLDLSGTAFDVSFPNDRIRRADLKVADKFTWCPETNDIVKLER